MTFPERRAYARPEPERRRLWPPGPNEMPPIYRVLWSDPEAAKPPPSLPKRWFEQSQELHHRLVVLGEEPRPGRGGGGARSFVYQFIQWMRTASGHGRAWLLSGQAWRSPERWPDEVAAANPLRLPPWLVAEASLPHDLRTDHSVMALLAHAQGITPAWGAKFLPEAMKPARMVPAMERLNRDPRVMIALAASHIRYLPGIRLVDDFLSNLERVRACLASPWEISPEDQLVFLESGAFQEALQAAVRNGGRSPAHHRKIPDGWRQSDYRVTTLAGHRWLGTDSDWVRVNRGRKEDPEEDG